MELSDSDCREVEDVVVLSELNEDIIVRVLRLRYAERNIYTNAGNVLMAINPFDQVPLYSDDILNMYRKAFLPTLEKLAPHPWKTAAKAYIQMFGDNRQTCALLKPTACAMRPQSVLVSGESGAGKTETTKIIMAFLAKVSSLNRRRESLGTIQCNVLEANTILDAVGNARTMRNDNSSRFGKYVKLHFDSSGELIGAGMDTFLLETTRVVRRNVDEERNFHIFYLLCSEANETQRELLKMRDVSTYTYLNSSGVYDRRDGVMDADMLELFKASMTMLNIEADCMQSLLKCFMAILTVGNIRFSSHTNDAGSVEIKVDDDTQQYLVDAADLLEICPHSLLQSFTIRTMIVAHEELSVTLTSTQAEELRDVFAKTLYSVLFAWLIDFLNVQLSTEDNSFESYSLSSETGPQKLRRRSSHSIVTGIDQFGARIRVDSETSSMSSATFSASDTPQKHGMIGILDIFGFEKQQQNGLEQLLINYANEMLQKQYDEVMIDSEQAFYASENINWDFIQFPSNADCIELISNKGVSILSLLDEACLAPSGSDSSFIHQIYSVLSTHKRLHLTSRIQGNNEFGINHYAGTVVYSVANFVNKNKNEIFPLELLKTSSDDFVKRIGQSAMVDENRSNGGSSSVSSSPAVVSALIKPSNSKKFLTATISNSFKKSVAQLIHTIGQTQAHYVKCIKPNSINVKNNFMVDLVAEQLRCNGIMQTIVVTRCGYPIRFTYEHFSDRYFSLMRALMKGQEFTLTAGVDAVIDRLREALSSGEITIRDSVTTLDSVGGLQKAIKRSGSCDSINNSDLDGWGIQRGDTRVFLRYNECGALDKMHHMMVGKIATDIQRVYRGFKCARVFRAMKVAARKISRSYRQYYNNLMLMVAVVYMQHFFRKYVWFHVQQKRHARFVINVFVYRNYRRLVKRLQARRLKAAILLHRWWTSRPEFISSERRLFLKVVFSSSIRGLQQGVRSRLADMKRVSVISNYRRQSSLIKQHQHQHPHPHLTPKKSRIEEAWHAGSPSRFVSFDNCLPPTPSLVVSTRDLLKANSQILWTIFSFYAEVVAAVPPNNSTSVTKRNSIRLVSVNGMISLLKDWSLVPSLSTQYKAKNLLKDQLTSDKSSNKLFSFTHFLTFISNLAANFYKENDTRELTDKIKLLDDKFQWPEEVIALKHLLTVMNSSDGRSKFSQSRNACLVPSFVGVDGSEEALNVFFESQASTALNGIAHSSQSVTVNPTFREVEMSTEVQLLMRRNESTLVSLALRYCPDTKPGVTSTPGSKKDTRKSHVALSLEAVYSLLHDFDVCPVVCGKAVLQTLYTMVEERFPTSKGMHRGLTFALFTELLDHVAQNCEFGTKKFHTPEGRVRAMFHHMNTSRGRSKLNKDSNSLIINPLTGLESTDPKLESNSSHRKNVVSKVSALIAATPEKDATALTPSKKKPTSHYHHLRSIKTPPRDTLRRDSDCEDKPEWNFR